MPGLTLPGDTRFLLGSARDRRTDGRRCSCSCVGIPAVHLVAGYRHARCSAVRLLAPLLHGHPAPTASHGAAWGGSPSTDPRAVGAPPQPLAVTALGFAWQRPGPAELPAHRRPDRQDRRLRALALQVQSKAGLGEEGAGGLRTRTLRHAHLHPRRRTLHRALHPPASTHTSPLPSGAGAAPWALLGGGGLYLRPPHKGLFVPRDQAAPPGLCPPRPAAPPEHEWGACSPCCPAPWPPAQPSAMQPGLSVTAWAALAVALCQHIGLGDVCPSLCPARSWLPAAPGRAEIAAREWGGRRRLWGWRGARDREVGGAGSGAGGLCRGSGAQAGRGGSGTWGAAMGWLGRAGGGGAGDSSCRGAAGPLHVGLTFSSRTDPAYLAG